MRYQGYQLRVSYAAWEQVGILGDFWDCIAEKVGTEKIAGLGYGWENDYFNYAVGVIEDEETLTEIRRINFDKSKFKPKFIEIELPARTEWTEYAGKTEKIREIYEDQINCYDRKYDYELEYFDNAGNAKILIHYMNQ